MEQLETFQIRWGFRVTIGPTVPVDEATWVYFPLLGMRNRRWV